MTITIAPRISILLLLLQLLLLLLISLLSTTIGKEIKYFYIYEEDDWPLIANASVYKRDPNERLENQLNNGLGPVINTTLGSYHTDQYQLFSMIYYRLLKDIRRTLDPSKAITFFIPYDIATDCAYYKNCVKRNGVCYDFRKCPLAPKVESLLQKSSYMTKNNGHDHFLIVGMNYAMNHYLLKPKCKAFLSGICKNCTKFAIDDYSYMYATDVGIKERGDSWHAIPFPSNFHWNNEVIKPFPWENIYNRTILASYIGTDKSFYGPARRLRGSIVHYCNKHNSIQPNLCVHQSYGLNGTRFSYKVDNYNPLLLSSSSIFCFQPIGDLMTRKGLFDSLLQGCIPVTFDDLTAAVMYTWHWNESFWRDISIEMDFHGVAHRYKDPIEILLSLQKEQPELIKRKQELIKSKVFELQYSRDGRRDYYQYNSRIPYLTLLEPIKTLSNSTDNSTDTSTVPKEDVIYHFRTRNNLDKNSQYDSKTNTELVINDGPSSNWPKDHNGNYMRDAYDITMDYVLGWHSKELVHFRNATVPECWEGWLNKKENKCSPGTEPK